MSRPSPLVVVTGASGGIGSAVTEALKAAGAEVIGVDRSTGSTANRHVEADLADPRSIGLVGEAVGDRPLRGLVNNAAASTTSDTADVSPSLWDEILAVNLRAPFFLAEALLENLLEGSGCVVNVSSVHAIATSRGAVPYAASKGGLVALTRGQAVDWAARGMPVRSNAIVPGAIDTPMLRDGLTRTGVALAELGRRHPSGRVGEPHEVASLVRWLVLEDSGFVNGATINIDGGALAQLSTEVHSGPTDHSPQSN